MPTKDFRTLASEIDSEIADLGRSKANPKKWGMAIKSVVEAANGAVESATRLAYFRALVENGVPEKEAARKSKDLTVNFNRRGDWKWVNQYWMFFNAAIQGSDAVIKMVRNPSSRKRGIQAMAAIASAGAATVILNQYLGGRDEDSGKTHYERIQPWSKGMSAILLNPMSKDGSGVTFPLPYGLNVAWNLGRISAELALREDGYSTMDFASDISSSIIESFSPFGVDVDYDNWVGTVSDLFSPTAVKPWAELEKNKDFSGRPIYPQASFGAEKPDSEKYFRGVNPIARDLAAFLNEKTGGDKWHPGYVSVSPESIEHAFNAYTGGVGRILQQGFGIAKTLGEGEEVQIKQIPFARRYFRSADENVDRSVFAEKILNPAKLDWQQFRDMSKDEDPGAEAFANSHYANIVASVAFGGVKAKEGKYRRFEELGEVMGSSKVKDQYRRFFAKAWKAKQEMDRLQKRHNTIRDEKQRADIRNQIEREAEKAFEGFGD